MANELTVTQSFVYAKGNFLSVARAATALGINIGSDPFALDVIPVLTTLTNLPGGSIALGGNYAWLRNLDPTNFLNLWQPSKLPTGAPTISAVVAASGIARVTHTNHGFATGDLVFVGGVSGTTEANGGWSASVINVNTYDLVNCGFAHTYTSGGFGVPFARFCKLKAWEVALLRLGLDASLLFAQADTAPCNLEIALFSS